MLKDTQLYYCQAGNHYWYYDEEDYDHERPLFYHNPGDVTDEQAEQAKDKYCGCND